MQKLNITTMKKNYSFLFAAILYCGVGLLTSCTAYEDKTLSSVIMQQNIRLLSPSISF